MAIFASTTTSGYSDPVKAMNIKALEQRQKEIQAQMAQATITPENTQSPIQGFGHLVNQAGDQFRQGRNEQALASQREVLARSIAGHDPSKPPPAEIAVADPDLYRSMQQVWAQREAAREKVRTDEMATGQQNTFTAAQAAQKVLDEQATAREKVRTDEIARQQGYTHSDAAAAQKALDEQTLARTTAAADPKRLEAVRASETDYRKGLSHIENLEEATKILDHPEGIYTGAAQTTAPIASGIPGVNMFVNKEKAQRTSRYNTIVGEDAIRDMAETLKGSSTNFEMNEFKKMKNDPNISDKQRADQLRKVVKAARADLESQAKETKAIGGDTERIDRAMGGGAAPVDPLEGKTATGANGEKIIRRGGKWVPNG